MEFVKVVIVGGGVAGLGAAKTLDSKVDYLLVEAQDYLGGRIHTVDAASNAVIDLGAQFVHGEANNIVYEICKQLNCILIEKSNSNDDDMLVLTSNQNRIDSDLMMNAMRVWENILDKAKDKFRDNSLSSQYSFADYLLANLKISLSSELKLSEELIDAMIEFFEKSELIENGCLSLKELSLKEYGSFIYLAGNYDGQLQNGGYRPLIAYLKSFISDPSRIHLNSEVIRVKYLSDQQRLQIDIRDTVNQSIVRTLQCEHVIWTSSLGYLKENFTSVFQDEIELIQEKKLPIENLGFDTVNKVILVYEKAFWPKDILEIIVLNTMKDHLSDSFDKYKQNPRLRKIIESIFQYDVPPSTQQPVLLCWFGGEAAVLIEDFDENLIGDICHEVLCFYLNISPKLNLPIRVLKSGWHKNRYVRGSYTYYSTKSTQIDGEQLRKPYAPDGIPRIQFAGEATHETFYSTVHGALESGIREGNRLLASIQMQTNS